MSMETNERASEAAAASLAAAGGAPLMQAKNLDKWYKGVHALKDVSLDIGHAEVIGLVGDNGAGKSTLIKILSGSHRPDAGEIYFQGKKVTLSSTRVAMELGIETIYQHTAMVPQMSIARNIFIGREPVKMRIGGFGILDTAKMGREAMAALEGVELHLRSPNTPVDELSGGERQGVAIARAMYFKTKLLILDEPTNHLSVKETDKVLRFVRGLKDQGITSIFITHNLHHVYPIADRLVVMARGEKIGDMRRDDTTIEDLTDMII
jgi:simple sugar transport system ATP-binding protein